MKLLTIDESAQKLDMSRRTFDRVKYKKGFPRPFAPSKRHIRYIEEDLDKWLIKQLG